MLALQPVERHVYSEGKPASRREAGAGASFRPPPPQAIRPRFGMGPRVGEAHRARSLDKGALRRTLAISSAVLVLGSGLLLGLHLLRPGEAATDASAQAQPGPATPKVHVTAIAPVQPGKPAATRGSEALAVAPGGKAAPSRHDEAAARRPVQPGAPTAQDFARPAFIEPIETLAQDDAAVQDDTAPDDAPVVKPARKAAPMPAAARTKTRQVATAAASDDVTGSIGKAGRLTRASFLRAKPSRGSKVLASLSKGAKVTVYSCKSWCEVATDGKRGYVYGKALKQ